MWWIIFQWSNYYLIWCHANPAALKGRIFIVLFCFRYHANLAVLHVRNLGLTLCEIIEDTVKKWFHFNLIWSMLIYYSNYLIWKVIWLLVSFLFQKVELENDIWLCGNRDVRSYGFIITLMVWSNYVFRLFEECFQRRWYRTAACYILVSANSKTIGCSKSFWF